MTTLTIEEQLEELRAMNSKLTAALAAKPVSSGPSKRIIKVNSSNGIFIRDAAYKGMSKAGKDYIVSMNIPAHCMGLFTGLLKDKKFQENVMSVISTGEEFRS